MKTIHEAVCQSPLVYAMRQRGASHEEIICALVEQVEEMVERAIQLDMIAPRKVICKDGHELVWHCPSDLIPEARVQDLRVGVAKPA